MVRKNAHQASPSRTNHVARPSGGSAASRLSLASDAQRAGLSDNEQCQCSSRRWPTLAIGPRHEHGHKPEAVAAIAMHPNYLGCVLCCFVTGVLLLLRPNRAPSLGGVLHEGEACASRHASRRPRPRSTYRGQKRGLHRDAPLLLLAAWLRVCSAEGTICSVKPSVCSGTYSSSSLHLDGESKRFYGGVLSGTIPTQLGALTALQEMYFGQNEAEWQPAQQLGALTALEDKNLEKKRAEWQPAHAARGAHLVDEDGSWI